MTLSEKTVLLDGLRVRYWEDGEGHSKTLLLVHGGIGNAQLHWETVLPMLAENFHVLAPDLPGFGQSQLLPRMRLDVMMHWIKSFMDSQKLEQAVLIGSSFGALLVRLFAAANPTYSPAIILVNGGGVPDIPPTLRLMERIPVVSQFMFSSLGKQGTSEETLKQMIHIEDVLTDSFKSEVKSAAPGYARLMRMMIGSGMPKSVTPLVPTLILWGVEDKIATVKEAQAIKVSIPGAELTEIKDCGHMPQLETPDVFAWQVMTFLDKLSRPTKTGSSGARILPNVPS
ncbi:MAG: alpha/beta hydrolase [Anaerolineae bacterium]|nr:alpha/beta hydrolase [Anaerolineae bacterium]